MEYTVRWTDGSTWRADHAVFERVTAALESVRGVIVGLDPILARWSALAARGAELPVDDFAPREADRAVFTAALERAVEDARASRPGEGVTLERLGALHELFMTDITRG